MLTTLLMLQRQWAYICTFNYPPKTALLCVRETPLAFSTRLNSIQHEGEKAKVACQFDYKVWFSFFRFFRSKAFAETALLRDSPYTLFDGRGYRLVVHFSSAEPPNSFLPRLLLLLLLAPSPHAIGSDADEGLMISAEFLIRDVYTCLYS